MNIKSYSLLLLLTVLFLNSIYSQDEKNLLYRDKEYAYRKGNTLSLVLTTGLKKNLINTDSNYTYLGFDKMSNLFLVSKCGDACVYYLIDRIYGMQNKLTFKPLYSPDRKYIIGIDTGQKTHPVFHIFEIKKQPKFLIIEVPKKEENNNIIFDDCKWVTNAKIVVSFHNKDSLQIEKEFNYILQNGIWEQDKNKKNLIGFRTVEQMPEYPGGEEELMKFISWNINYPQLARETGISGTVIVQFIVEKDGSISNIKVVRGLGGGCDEEAVRFVKSMPKWKPGKEKGVAVPVYFTLPIKFHPNKTK